MSSLWLPRDGVQPSYPAGFARSAAESANPGLWDSLVGAWVPALGPTGGVIRDLISSNSLDPYTGADEWEPGNGWVVRRGAWQVYLDGRNDYFNSQRVMLHGIGAGPFTFVAGMERDGNPTSTYAGILSSGAYSPAMYANIGAVDGQWGGYWGGNMLSGNTLSNNVAYSLAMRRIGDEIDFWQNGQRTPTQHAKSSSMSDAVIHFGSGVDANREAKGWIKYAYIYDRALTASEMMQIYCYPLSLCRLAPLWVSVAGAEAAAEYPQFFYGSRDMTPLIQM